MGEVRGWIVCVGRKEVVEGMGLDKEEVVGVVVVAAPAEEQEEEEMALVRGKEVR